MMYPNTVYNPNMYSTNNMPVPPNVNMGHMGYAANAHNMPPPPMNYSPSMPSVPRHSIVHQHPTLLVVEDLPVECSEGDLLLLIQPYARVKSINMNRHPQRRNSTFAVVEFHMPEQGEGARVNLDGMFFMGRKLRVFWDTNNQTGLHAASSSPYAMAASNPVAAKFVRTAQVHISYLSKQLNSIVSEEFLRDIFSNFGEVVEVALKKVSIDPVSK